MKIHSIPYFRSLKNVSFLILQIAILSLFYWGGKLFSHTFHLNIPGSIVGLIFLFILLQLKIVRLEWIELGGNFLLKYMLLFFVPISTGIIQYGHLIRLAGFQLILVIFFSTLAVMISTGIFSERLIQLRQKGEASK